MPVIGAGTYVGDEKGHTSARDCADLVGAALEAGFRHFDSAMLYGNEVELGEALRRGGEVVPSEFYVTTKVAHPNDVARGHTACTYMEDPAIDAREGVLANIRACSDRLKLGRPIDLVLIHWPGRFPSTTAELNEKKRWEMWQGLEDAQEKGLCRSIGVASFTVKHLKQLLARGPRVVPAVNQIEVNPLHRNWELTQLCQSNDIQVCAWSPFGLGRALSSEPLAKIGRKYGCSPAAVTLRWLSQRNIVPLPRSVKKERLRENYLAVLHPEFTLSPDELETIDMLDEAFSVFGGKSPLPESIA